MTERGRVGPGPFAGSAGLLIRFKPFEKARVERAWVWNLLRVRGYDARSGSETLLSSPGSTRRDSEGSENGRRLGPAQDGRPGSASDGEMTSMSIGSGSCRRASGSRAPRRLSISRMTAAGLGPTST